MPRSLVRTVYSLAKYEHYKKRKYYSEDGEEHEAPLLTNFLDICGSLALSEKSCDLILAADRLIGNLFSYRDEISLGQRYFQPIFYKPKRFTVWFNWDDRNKSIFCAGCYRKKQECSRSPFSSRCPYFRTAWAVEHVIAATNRLVQFTNRKSTVIQNA